MNELDLQDKYLINFLCTQPDGLLYKEVKANTVSRQFLIVEDLKHFISETSLNKDNYRKLLRKFNSEKALLDAFTEFINGRIKSSMNMAIFLYQRQQNGHIWRGDTLPILPFRLLIQRRPAI